MRAAIGLLFFWSQLTFATQEFFCPAALDVDLSAKEVGSDFELDSTKKSYFCRTIGIYIGHPKNLVQLKPDPDFDRAGRDEPFWMSCVYAENSKGPIGPSLYKVLPASLTHCKVQRRPKEACAGVSCS